MKIPGSKSLMKWFRNSRNFRHTTCGGDNCEAWLEESDRLAKEEIDMYYHGMDNIKSLTLNNPTPTQKAGGSRAI